MPNLSEHTALVTGASSGIGQQMARILASWGADLILVARRKQRLETLAGQLRADHGVQVRCIPCDLSAPGAAANLYDQVRGSLDILVNNAGFGAYRDFADTESQRNQELLQLNVSVPVELTHHFVQDVLGRERRAYVLNVSSIAAYAPVPYFATYSGSKAFIRSFTESLAAELAGSNVSATCLAPGGTRSEFSDVAGQPLNKAVQHYLMSPERCAEAGLQAMLRRRPIVVPGLSNKLIALATRLVPRRTAGSVARAVIGQPIEPRKPEADA